MKNKMVDVRNHLVLMLEQLGDPDCKPEVIERAKATSLVAGTYISAVKTEIDAIRMADEIGRLPVAVAIDDIAELPQATRQPLRVLTGGR